MLKSNIIVSSGIIFVVGANFYVHVEFCLRWLRATNTELRLSMYRVIEVDVKSGWMTTIIIRSQRDY